MKKPRWFEIGEGHRPPLCPVPFSLPARRATYKRLKSLRRHKPSPSDQSIRAGSDYDSEEDDVNEIWNDRHWLKRPPSVIHCEGEEDGTDAAATPTRPKSFIAPDEMEEEAKRYSQMTSSTITTRFRARSSSIISSHERAELQSPRPTATKASGTILDSGIYHLPLRTVSRMDQNAFQGYYTSDSQDFSSAAGLGLSLTALDFDYYRSQSRRCKGPVAAD